MFRLARRFALGAGLAAIVLTSVPTPTMAAAPADRLPDLRIADIADFHIVTSGGRRLLRFTGLMWNSGAGAFETRANRKSLSTPWGIQQIVYNTAGGSRRINTSAGMQFAGDGHDHWHVKEMMTYHLWGSRGTSRDSKIGFCFFDTNLINGKLPRSPSRRVYSQSSCGHRTSLFTRNGISVGWGDKYPWNFAFQWIDITGVPAGTYLLRGVVDLNGYFKESSETNNCTWARLRIGASGTALSVLERGTACINDYSNSPYAADIAWAREVGISDGCGGGMFCTNNPTTRGDAATFISRAFKVPAATHDYYSDDATNANQANINRVTEARIATHCAVGKFCPLANTNRVQVASMLARALGLPPSTQDYFDDDDGAAFEEETNRLAEAGGISGCGERTFCPKSIVTRGQLMALLHRALVPPVPPAS